MAGEERVGLAGLVECLSEQQLLRGTGVVEVGTVGTIHVVFGHPLHARAGTETGVAAVDVLGRHARDEPACTVRWAPGVTAGKAHSIGTGDGVVERLRALGPAAAPDPHRTATPTADLIADLGLRRRLAFEAPPVADPGSVATPADPMWGIVISSICASFESVLRLHSAPFVAVIRSAQPEPVSILAAIGRARRLYVRAVSLERVGGLLDEAEALVRQTMTA